jgi:asparagine synthase (glutamine-hydrolysing)
MCGIVGYIGEIDSNTEAQLQATFYRHTYRGPDHQAWQRVSPRAALGFQRLAIRGLGDAGNQPLWSADQHDAVICNGEIYNEVALYDLLAIAKPPHATDCAVILPLVRQFGIQRACELLDAEFAFVYHDGVAHKTYAARDPIGIRPLFYGTPLARRATSSTASASSRTATSPGP